MVNSNNDPQLLPATTPLKAKNNSVPLLKVGKLYKIKNYKKEVNKIIPVPFGSVFVNFDGVNGESIDKIEDRIFIYLNSVLFEFFQEKNKKLSSFQANKVIYKDRIGYIYYKFILEPLEIEDDDKG